MRLFSIRGGVHPKDRKELSADKPISPLPLPSLMRVPLQQHIGNPAEPVVNKGDHVLKGQVIGMARGPISAPVHAPTSGQVIAIGRFAAPHPSGLPGRTITLRPDGKDEWAELPPSLDPFKQEPEVIARRVAESGIVGMGGATFPSAVKLNLRDRFAVDTLVINGAECEPYLTCDDRLMRERAKDVIDGVRIMVRALGAERALIAIETNKPDAIKAMRLAAMISDQVQIVSVPTRYPMGSEKHLVQTLTGKETPARALTAELGVVVHNAATAYAVHRAVRHGEPLISRIVTVSGGAMTRTANLEAPIGTPISHILEHCGGFSEEPDRMLLGGPMMGQPLVNVRAPIVKGTGGILALTAEESAPREAGPCIRCGSCVTACPCGLEPLDMAARIRKEELDSAAKIGLLDCIACGSCAYVCPAGIPLVQYFNYAKGKLTAISRSKQKQQETKRLAEQREARIERIQAAKREAMARMKAERAAKKKAAEEAARKVSA